MGPKRASDALQWHATTWVVQAASVQLQSCQKLDVYLREIREGR